MHTKAVENEKINFVNCNYFNKKSGARTDARSEKNYSPTHHTACIIASETIAEASIKIIYF